MIISTLGGLAAAGVLHLLAQTLGRLIGLEWLLDLALSGLLVLLVVAFLVMLWIWAYRTLGRHKVLVALSAFKQHTYFAELARCLVVGLERDEKPTDVVLKVPGDQYDEMDQYRALEGAVRRKFGFRGAVIVPIGNTGADLRNFIRRFKRPVVFVDTPPWKEDIFPPRSGFVGVDSVEGGCLAADAMAFELEQVHSQESGLRLLVIPGGFHPERERAFESRLRQLLNRPTFIPCQPAEFLRSEAASCARSLLRVASKTRQPFHGVFCTGDEMALGVLDAVAALEKEGREPGVDPDWVLIGYDAIPEARRIIEAGDTPFKNTVVQDPKVLAKEALRALHELRHGRYDTTSIRVPARLLRLVPHPEPSCAEWAVDEELAPPPEIPTPSP